MKCNQCHKEWSMARSSSIPVNCPYCGASLQRVQFSIDNAESAGDVVREIVTAYGEDILLNQKIFFALFGDLAPQLKKEKKIFHASMSSEVMELFMNCTKQEQSDRINRVKYLLNDILSEDAADLFIRSIAYGLGWDIEIINTSSDSEHSLKTAPVSKPENSAVTKPAAKVSLKERIKQADRLVEQKRYSEAEPIYKEAMDAGMLEGYFGMGVVCFRVYNDNDKAMHYFKYIVENGPEGNADVSRAKIMCAAICEMETGDKRVNALLKASQYYESVLDEKDRGEPFFKKTAQQQLEKMRSSVQSVASRVMNGMTFSEVSLNAIEMINKDMDQDAETALIFPLIMGEELAWMAMGLLCYKIDRSKEALIYLNRYLNRAKSRECAEEAQELITQIMKENSSSNTSGDNFPLFVKASKANQCLEDGKTDEALQLAKEAADAGIALGQAVVGQCLLRKSEYDQAMYYLKSAEKGFINDNIMTEDQKSVMIARMNVYIGDCWFHKLDHTKALEHYRIAASKDPSCASQLQERYKRCAQVNSSAASSSVPALPLNDYIDQLSERLSNGSVHLWKTYILRSSYLDKGQKKKSEKALAKALQGYAQGADPNSVYVVNGSGRSGYLLTDSHLYWKQVNSGSAKLSKIQKVFKTPVTFPSGFEINIQYMDDYDVLINTESNSNYIVYVDTEEAADAVCEMLLNFVRSAQQSGK